MAHGSASYSIDTAGNATTTRATVNSLNPVTVGTMAQHQMIVAASNNLGSSESWQQTMDTARRASLTSSEAQGFTSRLDNAMRENWQRAISDKSSFVHSMGEEARTQLSGGISSGNIPLFKRVGAQAQLAVIGKNGEQVSFNVSEDVARSFENTAAQVRSESLQQTLQDSKNLDYMTKLAKQIGATEAYSYLKDARELRTSTESYGADLTTALVRNYANERYGSESPENIRRTISDFNHYLTQQGSQGVNNMQDIINGFVSGKGYGWGDTSNEVHDAINSTRGRAQSQGFKQDVGMSAMEAGAKTFDVNGDSFSTPASKVPLDNPNPNAVTNPADDIHRRNRLEESGNGGIHTTAGGIAKDMAGLNKNDPLSPTSELYRNESFYYEGNLVHPQQRQSGGIVLPSGTVIHGKTGSEVPQDDKEFFKGSVFEKE
jgi:conjugal transfer mating pair stabilization protein TraG